MVLLHKIGFHFKDRPYHFHMPIASSYTTRREAPGPKGYLCQAARKIPVHANVACCRGVGAISVRWGLLTGWRTSVIAAFPAAENAAHHFSLHINFKCTFCSLFYVCTSLIGHGFLQCYRKLCWQQAALLRSKPNCNTNTNGCNLQ